MDEDYLEGGGYEAFIRSRYSDYSRHIDELERVNDQLMSEIINWESRQPANQIIVTSTPNARRDALYEYCTQDVRAAAEDIINDPLVNALTERMDRVSAFNEGMNSIVASIEAGDVTLERVYQMLADRVVPASDVDIEPFSISEFFEDER